MKSYENALHLVQILQKEGFIAYFAGGWVRDFLLGHPSDDIDIATNAPLETLRTLSPHTIPIGAAFGILLVIHEGHEYEVATFRKDFEYKDGRRPTQIAFANPEEDAQRRDFTINGMFYNPTTNEIHDFVGGQRDLQNKIIRAIGNPEERIQEDRLRMIRAIRFSCRFSFSIDPETKKAISSHAKELFPSVAIERVWQELVKGHRFSRFDLLLSQLFDYGLLTAIFPELAGVTKEEIEKRLSSLIHYPKEAPTIAFLLPLFPNASLEQELLICQKFRLSQKEQQFVSFFHESKKRLQRSAEISKWEWAHFYAHSLSSLCLQLFAASLPLFQKESLWHEHEQRLLSLASSIDRIRRGDPLIKAKDLFPLGIRAGVLMGQLLKAAEKISIEEGIEEKSALLHRLQQDPLWPHS